MLISLLPLVVIHVMHARDDVCVYDMCACVCVCVCLFCACFLQILMQTLTKRGLRCRCMRCREVRGQEFKEASLVVRRLGVGSFFTITVTITVAVTVTVIVTITVPGIVTVTIAIIVTITVTVITTVTATVTLRAAWRGRMVQPRHNNRVPASLRTPFFVRLHYCGRGDSSD